ncbi:MAG TPA: type II toxin-antitoxin system prevent-host-death family antitoxin [Jatrophihabitantaceae bacterium]|nr:type II toxin-antitoxin system prevent-host-death family antitoxin [Jatrophihabitantaceae bacterium]
MRTVTHREMRNQSGEILRLVAAGEAVQVTNNGRIAAVIWPPGHDALALLEADGQLRRARRPVSDLATIRRRTSQTSTAEIVRDVRGSW